MSKPHLLIVEARFYDDMADALLEGAKFALDEAGATYDVITVPGALEIPAAIAMALRVTTLSPQAVTFSKQLIHQARDGVPRSAALAVERERFVDLFDHPDQREGVNAFLEKRAPRWQSAYESETLQ